MEAYVYQITNLINGKCYIGKTNGNYCRWSQHKTNARSSIKKKYSIHKAIEKYGENNFIYQVIKTCIADSMVYAENEALEYERVLISLFQLRDRKFGYNIVEGGGGAIGLIVPEENKIMYKDIYTGSKSVRAKFTDEDIISILNDYQNGNNTCKELSIKYYCGKATIIRIISGESYGDIEYDRSAFKEIVSNNKRRKSPKMEENNKSKLTRRDVLKIRELFQTGKYSYGDIALLFDVTRENIFHIIKRKTWKDI